MCTAIKYSSNGNVFFGRTLDNDIGYKEEIVILPRRRRLEFTNGESLVAHNAIIGIAHVADGLPLFYDACNDRGLAMAGLNYVGNAVYFKPKCDAQNIASYEFILWVLSKCASVDSAKKLLNNVNITDAAVAPHLPPSQLHWMIADKNGAITVESDADGLHVYDNDVCVLTNNPPFPFQKFSLNNYMGLSHGQTENRFSDKLKLDEYSRGMGAMGLPGDLSSQSRFIRAAFTLLNSPECSDCISSVGQFFHIMGTVGQTRGSCILGNGKYETTIYTSCFDITKGVLYYSGYDNRRLTAVDMNKANLEGSMLIKYPMINEQDILMQN